MMNRTKWLAAAFLIVLGGSRLAFADSPACPKLPPLWRGALWLAAGRHERTVAICDEVLHRDSDNRCAYMLRGYAHLSKKNEEQQAITDFSKALRRGPDNAALHVARAYAYYDAKDYDRAIADCTEAIRIDPTFAEAYASRGDDYLEKQVINKAVTDYSIALRINPFLTWARCGRGEAYRRRGESARALADLEEAVRNDPGNYRARYNRCLAYLLILNDCDGVIAESSERIQRYPKDANWYALRGMAYMAKGEVSKSLRDGTTAASLKPGYFHLCSKLKPHSLCLGMTFGSGARQSVPWAANPDESIAACTKRLAADPDNVAAYYERSYAHIKKCEYKQAIADFDEILRRDPADATAYLERSSVRLILTEYDRAIADCTTANRIDPDNADSYYTRAYSYAAQGKCEEAIRDYSHALRLDPRMARVLVLRGILYRNRKEHAAARADFSEAIRLYPVFADAYIQRGWDYAKSGKYTEAVADFKKVLEFDPQNAMAHRCLGWWLAVCPDAHFRDGKEAKAHAATACEATEWKDPVYLDIYAAACAECGDFADAIKWQTRVLKSAPEKDKADYRRHLDLYRSHHPYHEAAAR